MTVEIYRARERGVKTGSSWVIAGPGGTGKSWLLGSMASLGPTLLIATLPREVNSYLYQKFDVEYIVLADENWLPEKGRYEAEAYMKFLDICETLLDDATYRNIIIENGTELGEAAWHETLKLHSVASPAEIPDKKSRWLPYEQLYGRMDRAIKAATNLTKLAKLPKTVAFSWHTQPPRDDVVEVVDQAKVVKESADHAGRGIEYEGNQLPTIRGAFRRRLINKVDVFLFTDLQQENRMESNRLVTVPKYVVQVQPDVDRHTKWPGPLPPHKYLDVTNDERAFERLLGLLQVPSDAAKRSRHNRKE